MAAVAQLKAVLGIETSKYRAGVRGSENETKQFQKTLSSVGRTMAAAFSVTAIVGFTRRIIDFASEIRHAADNLNVTTDALQGLNALALKSGVSLDQVSRALAKTKDAQGNISAGGEDAKRYADALEAMNINAEAFASADSAEALQMIGEGLNSATNEAAAFSAVSDLLGEKVGPRLNSMLRELGTDGLQTVIDKASEAGHVVEDGLITKLELLGTKSEQVLLRMKVAWAQFTGRLLTGAAQFGAVVNSMKSQFSEESASREGGAFSTSRTFGAALSVVRDGGMGKAIDAAQAIAAEADKAVARRKEEDAAKKADRAKAKAAGDDWKVDYATQLSKAQDFNEKLRIAMLDGREKLKAELVAKEKEIAEEIAKTQSTVIQHMLADRAALYRQQYEKDLQAIEESEAAHYEQREKAVNARVDRQGRKGGAGGGESDLHPEIYGRGVRIDHMAAVGGMIGGDRSGVAAANRKLQVDYLKLLARRADEQAPRDDKRNVLLEGMSDPEDLR